MMSKDKRKSSFLDSMGYWATYVYVLVMLGFYPVFYRENILHIIRDKKDFFLFFTILYLIVLCPAGIASLAALWKKNISEKFTVRADTIYLLVLALSAGFSVFFAPDRNRALNGLSYRTVAADVFLLCILVYFGVRTYGKYTSVVIWSWLFGSTSVYLFGILSSCKINFLHMQDGLGAPHIFLSPLGNSNFNASFVCLVLPLVLAMYMVCKEAFSKIIYAVVMYIGFLFTIFIKTESSVISILAALLLLFFFALEKEEWFRRFAEIVVIFAAAHTTIFLLLQFWEDHLWPFDGLDAFLLRGFMVLSGWLAAAVLWGVSRWKAQVRLWLLKWRKVMVCSLGIAAVLFVVIFVFVNLIFAKAVQGSIFERLLLTNESFSNRGILWKSTIELLRKSSFTEILFGHGLNCYQMVIMPFHYEEMIQYFGTVMTDPHNEFLQVFTDMGILGTCGYFGFLISSLVFAFRRWKENEWMIAAVISISIYLLQGLVNCYAIFHLPILFLFLGLVNGGMGKDD